jgi:glucose/mannose transport system substrate-binding protein
MRRQPARVCGWISPALLLSSLGGAGCESDAKHSPATVHLELISWWVSADEKEALDALVEVHKKQHPNVDVANSNVAAATSARSSIRTRMAAGLPPNTFQANIGNDLLQWVAQTARPNLEALDTLIDLSAFPKPLRDQAGSAGSAYGIPLNVHRINSLFYDKRFFASNQLSPPTSVQELRTLCPIIKRLGRVCLAVGDLNSWMLSQITFEMILPGIAGAPYYAQFWQGSKQATDKNVTDALELMLYLRCGPRPTSACDDGYVNSDVDTIDWPDAVARVMAPKTDPPEQLQAAMTATGDWAKGNFVTRGWKPDEDFGVVPFPNPGNVFVYTADTFPLPLGVIHRAETIELLGTFASVEGQVAFNQIKGSIPARTDIGPADLPGELDSMHRQTMQEFQKALDNGTLALARTGLQKPNTMLGLDQMVRDSLAQGNILRIRQYLQANYPTLAQ